HREVIRAVLESKDKFPPTAWPGWSTSLPPESETRGVPGDVADVVTQFFVPTRPSGAIGVTRSVPPEAGNDGVGVTGIGVDGDPAPFAPQSPALQGSRGQRAFEELAAAQHVADRTGAVIALVPEAGVAASVDIGLVADPVGVFDRVLDAQGRRFR